MKNNIFIWGSKSYALLINKIFEDSFKDFSLFSSNNKKIKSPKLLFFFDPYSKKINFESKAAFFNNFNNFEKNLKKCNFFLVCIGNHYGEVRFQISKAFTEIGLNPISLISNHSLIKKNVKLGKGVIVMPNSFVNYFSSIGDFSIINSSANIEHECEVGSGCHIMSGATISGRVIIGNNVTVGANSTILPDLKVGDGAIIGAGSVVTNHIKKNQIVKGNPAKFYKKKIFFSNKVILSQIKKLNYVNQRHK